jgi:hypothetical protein
MSMPVNKPFKSRSKVLLFSIAGRDIFVPSLLGGPLPESHPRLGAASGKNSSAGAPVNDPALSTIPTA